MAKKIEIPMTAPNGEPWIAESEAEAFQLAAHGYARQDSEPDPAPAKEAPATAPATAPKS